METLYTTYIKVIDNTHYYFVKKYTHFPELKGVPDILESYGMHTDFDKACDIAQVNDEAVRQQLFSGIANVPAAKVIEMDAQHAEEKPHHGWFSNLRSIGLLRIAK
jgi:hypothetical protein